ncbi:hypothetical protein GCM10008967_43000 [Bacillus carboniphilus]|uniref:Uncharacterized protein n=1 Tax=Bacillus carboniphilus TaxID=86663 RepID=A0ABP3GKP1_9BACI
MIKYYCDLCRTIVDEPTICKSCGGLHFIEIKFSVHQQPDKDKKLDLEENA